MFTKADIEKYFFAEKQASLLFLIIGALAILLALTFYFLLKNNLYKGAAVPLLVIGLIQVIAGYSVYARSDKQRIDNVYSYDMNPSKLKNEELPRMKTVNKSFIMYKCIEVVFVITGIVLIFYFKSDAIKTFWFGFGIALTIEAIIMFSADFLAEKRAKVYTEQLESFDKK